jgi:hypothetical protein
MGTTAVLAAVAATLLLGFVGPRLPGVWDWLAPTPWMGLLGPLVALQAGLFAFVVARAGRSHRPPLLLALAAGLVAATALPGTGAAALLVPLGLSPASRHARVAAAACGLLLIAALVGSTAVGALAQLAILASAILVLVSGPNSAANDNAPGNWIAWWLRELPTVPA